MRVCERWENEEQLLAFRGSGPSGAQQAAVVAARAERFVVVRAGEP
ncbi:MAG: hypothetical protein KatS3mg009_0980 [Acidimicrobiia bacterium]|nr:MAG: hypothetical protein KatS3mg009_0980 [Acidimicrobiia bacterium]